MTTIGTVVVTTSRLNSSGVRETVKYGLSKLPSTETWCLSFFVNGGWVESYVALDKIALEAIIPDRLRFFTHASTDEIRQAAEESWINGSSVYKPLPRLPTPSITINDCYYATGCLTKHPLTVADATSINDRAKARAQAAGEFNPGDPVWYRINDTEKQLCTFDLHDDDYRFAYVSLQGVRRIVSYFSLTPAAEPEPVATSHPRGRVRLKPGHSL